MIRKCNFWDHTPPVPSASYRQAQLLYFDHISGNVLQIDRGTVWYQIIWVAIPKIKITCHGSQIWVSFVE